MDRGVKDHVIINQTSNYTLCSPGLAKQDFNTAWNYYCLIFHLFRSPVKDYHCLDVLLNKDTIWKQPKWKSIRRWLDKEVICIYMMEYYSAYNKKEQKLAICNSMVGVGGYYTYWNVKQRKTNTAVHITSTWNLKQKLMNIAKGSRLWI